MRQGIFMRALYLICHKELTTNWEEDWTVALQSTGVDVDQADWQGRSCGWSNPHRWASSTCLLDFHELPEIFFSLLEVLDDPINVWFRCHLASSTFEDSSTAWWLMFQVSLQIFMLSNQLLVSYSVFEMVTFSWDFIHLITLSNLLDCIENAIIKIASYISILCPN